MFVDVFCNTGNFFIDYSLLLFVLFRTASVKLAVSQPMLPKEQTVRQYKPGIVQRNASEYSSQCERVLFPADILDCNKGTGSVAELVLGWKFTLDANEPLSFSLRMYDCGVQQHSLGFAVKQNHDKWVIHIEGVVLDSHPGVRSSCRW